MPGRVFRITSTCMFIQTITQHGITVGNSIVINTQTPFIHL